MGSVCREFCSLRNQCLQNALLALLIAFLLVGLVFISAGTGWLINKYITHGDSFFIEQQIGPEFKFFLLSFMGFVFLALAIAWLCWIAFIVWKIYNCIAIGCRDACKEARERAARTVSAEDKTIYEQLEMVNPNEV
jgi:hypothetical protein